MRLEKVKVKKFRGIKDDGLEKCGDFNVLIGKNNSGKSTILEAIHTFFSFMSENSIASFNPLIGKPIDFYIDNHSTERSIEITVTFSLPPTDKISLAQEIAREYPHMRRIAEDMDDLVFLSVTINIININVPRAYISKMTLSNYLQQSERTLLFISKEAALEIFTNISNQRQLSKNKEDLKRLLVTIDSADTWERLTSRESRIRYSLSAALQRTLSTSLIESMEGLLSRIESSMEDKTYQDFLRTTSFLMKEFETELEENVNYLKENKIVTFGGESKIIPEYIQNILKNIADIKFLYLTEQRKQIGWEEAEKLLSLKVQRGGTKALLNIQEVISSLLGVQVDAFQGTAPINTRRRTNISQRAETNAELDVDNFLVEVNGAGIREALRLVLDYEFNQPDILLVEEPEIHLHPALETSMMTYLKKLSTKCQVFITTHSTNFLDTAEMQNVYLVSKPMNMTKIQHLNLEDAETQIPRELGIRLSSLFMFDRLIFVEGPSDISIIKEWASTLGINLGKKNIGFIPMGGARSFTHYAAEATLTFLTKRQVKIWFLLDKDERDSLEIEKLKNQLKGRAILKILDKREIENYLINVRCITEFIRLKKSLVLHSNRNDSEIGEEQIRKALDECAEELKKVIINKRVARIICAPIFPSLPKSFVQLDIREKLIEENRRLVEQLDTNLKNIDSLYEQETQKINNIWQEKKLDIIPGDDLLDATCQRFEIRFKKEIDGLRMASLMKKQEIAPEILAILEEIVK